MPWPAPGLPGLGKRPVLTAPRPSVPRGGVNHGVGVKYGEGVNQWGKRMVANDGLWGLWLHPSRATGELGQPVKARNAVWSKQRPASRLHTKTARQDCTHVELLLVSCRHRRASDEMSFYFKVSLIIITADDNC